MPPSRDDFLRVCEVLSEAENLQVTITESFKGALVVGASSFAGGLLGGSKGLLLGGILGSLGAAVMGSGKYKSVLEVIAHDMSTEQRNRLADSVSSVLNGFSIEDAAALSAIALNNNTAKQAVLQVIGNFMRDEMGLAVMSS